MFCEQKIDNLSTYTSILVNLNKIYENEENQELKKIIKITLEKIISFRQENTDFINTLIKENKELKNQIFGTINPDKHSQLKRGRYIKRMENDFKMAFELLGNSRTIQENHKVYTKLFDVRKIYLNIKEGNI